MTLLITKQTGNYFSFVLNGDTANEVSNDQNRLLTQGSLCNFKTGNGANIIKEQNISFSDITLIAGGTFTFASVDELWLKLIEVGFFDGLGNGGGTGGVDRFDELLDTFTYFGHSNEAVVVNASETALTTVELYNYSKFVELSDTPNTLVPNKMVVVNSLGTSLILIDQPQQQQQFLNSVGYFNYADTGNSVSFLANTEKKLDNDTLGSNTDISQSPFGIATVWNTDTNKFDFSQMDIGDTIDIRIDLDLANIIDKVFLKIGSLELPLFNSTSKIGLSSYITQLPINSNVKTNGAEVYVKSSINGSLSVVGFYTRILRKNINVVTIEGGSDLSANITSYDVTVESSTGTNAIIPSATTSLAGVMSATDKFVLDSIPDPDLKQDKLDGTGLVRVEDGVVSYDQNHYLTSKDLPSTLTLYPTNVVSGISNYVKLVTTIEDPDFNTVAVDISTGLITATNQLIAGLVTVPNLISGDPGVFNTTTIGNIRKVSGSGAAEFFFRIYKRTQAGVETLIGTSGVTIPTESTNYSEFQETALWDDGLFTETDRIVLKYYANRISGGSNPLYQFQFGGNSPVRTFVPIPTAVIPNIFLGELADVETGSALDKETLSYNESSSLWEYATVPSILGYTPEDASKKGVANGYASLDSGALIPSNQLPSYVDDILEFADLASFPISGESGKIYIAISPENLQYRWAGTSYVQITNGLIATTNDLPEGGFNLYFTVNRVLNSILTNLSTASSSVITAADTVLSALGKLQGQVSLKANDNSVVHLSGTETITGSKTFASSLRAFSFRLNEDNNSGLYYGHTNKVVLANYVVGGGIDFETNGGQINMVLDASANLYVAGNITGSNLSGTNTGDQDLSSYATSSELNLKANDNSVVHLAGTETITGNKIFTGALTRFDNPVLIKQLNSTDYNQIGAYSGRMEFQQNSGSQLSFNMATDYFDFGLINKIAKVSNTLLTANRNFEFPNASGTIALTSNLPTSANYIQNGTTLQTANFNISGNGVFGSSVTATSFIKSGGTASQFLKADGSVDSTQLPSKDLAYGTTYYDGYKERVLNNLGTTYPSETPYVLGNLYGQDLLQKASLIITPSGTNTSKLYAIKPQNSSGDLDVVRATTATRVNEDGIIENVASNTPRIDYDTVGGCPSVLLEPQRTNLLTYSDDFSNTVWMKDNLNVIPNTTISPNGTFTASTVNEGGGAGVHFLYNYSLPNLIIGNNYTETIFAKKNQDDWIQLAFSLSSFSSATWANFNLSTGQIGNKGANAVANIVALKDGYYKISLTGISTINGNSAICFVAPTNNTNSVNRIIGYQGTNRNNFYIWGAQLEQGSYATSYIPTVGSAVTRNADVISKTGISSLIGQTEGVLFVECSNFKNNTNASHISLCENTSLDNRNLLIFNIDGTVRFFVCSYGVIQINSLLSEIYNLEDVKKIAISYKLNDFKAYINGVLVFSQNTFNPSSNLSILNFSDQSGNNLFNGKVKQLQLYKTALTDAEMVTLTTL
jgi:hypothetical protein